MLGRQTPRPCRTLSQRSRRRASAAPAPSAETQRLLATDATQFDTELLDIYLTEAGEVLDTIADQRNGARRESRRSDGTAHRSSRLPHLEGQRPHGGAHRSGRTRVSRSRRFTTALIEEDRPTTPALIALIGVAESSFRRWVDALRATGRVTPDRAMPCAQRWPRLKASFPIGGGDSGGQPAIAAAERHRGRRRAGSPLFRRSTAVPISPHRAPRMRRSKCSSSTRRHMAKATWPILSPESRGADACVCRCRGRRTHPATDACRNACRCRTRKSPSASHAVGRAVSHSVRRGEAASGDVGRRAADSAVRPAATPSQLMVRASHTSVRHSSHRRISAGRHHCQGAGANACSRLQERGAPLPGAAQPVLARAVAGLERPERTRSCARIVPCQRRGRGGRDHQRAGKLRQDTVPQRGDRRQ